MKKGVVSLGEALIDFIPLDNENFSYQKSAGGAPANVAVGLARLGTKSTFLGKVGKDVLGHFLKSTLSEYGVNTEHMYLDEKTRTGVVFVTLSANGERSFDFYINPSADQMLKIDEIPPDLFDQNKILHFGSISLINEPVRSATKKAVTLAKEKGMLISYDPNLRLNLWPNEEAARMGILSMLDQVDVLKVSEEELEFITGKKDLSKGLEALAIYQIPLIFITLGENGSIVYINGERQSVPAMKVDAIDTTGAGDAFVSGILYLLNQTENDLGVLTMNEVVEMVKFASISGGLAASTKGAMTALPTLKQVEEILQSL
ncbi:aminoimidazole riboside kinase [Alkalihalobacterium alkalinitrilicum]|uniref:aminoimidazole riboside kinase n=1 Tax=Alkalihalobacterium alkalinitrilicum TaxID=427920 RepID=UPI000994F123|nr:aminoimidazole riboside kinase [Alkalihalobacterium alkalinitrilicum]